MHVSPLLREGDYLHYRNPYQAVTTDNGRIFDVLVIIGLKSTLSCLVGSSSYLNCTYDLL